MAASLEPRYPRRSPGSNLSPGPSPPGRGGAARRRERVLRAHRAGPPDVRTIFEAPRGEGHRFRREQGLRAWCDLCTRYIFSGSLRCADCKYTCHAHCRDLVHLDCQHNGKSMERIPSYDAVDPTNNNNDKQDSEKEAHPRLTKEEIKNKIEKYNSVVTDKLRMTLGPNGIYTGFIKVQMELRRPITVRSRVTSGILSPNNNNGTAFYLPKGSTNILHISSTNTVHEVIEALLKKFLVADNPAKFVLYKRRQKDDQVCMCKLSDREQPLYLRLVAGPSPEMLSFVLREHDTGDVTWEAFSLPELQNFLRILDKEEDEQLHLLTRRYCSYKEKLEEALNGVKKPG